MQDLNISIIQSDLHWESPEANLAMFEEKIWQITMPTDIIVLPEMFNTGFTMDAERLAEPMNSRTFRWMKQQAAQKKAVIIGSFIIKEDYKYYNRLFWVEPDGQFSFYDKRHLFRMAEEDKIFSAGTSLLIQEYKGWKICPLVCYDLRFPVWSRNKTIPGTTKLDYDLLIYIANWPESRAGAWDILLKARAIENLSFAVGVNRTGVDGKEIRYNGHSAIISPKGESLEGLADEEKICSMNLNYQELDQYRQKFPAFLDSDNFEIKL